MMQVPNFTESVTLMNLLATAKKETADVKNEHRLLKIQYDKIFLEQSCKPIPRPKLNIGTQTKQICVGTVDASTQTDPIELIGGYSLHQGIINLPGNDKCCDCGSKDDVSWISLKFGVVLCMQCSAFHMISHNFGVQYSRIQNLKFDNITTDDLLIARAMGNNKLNHVMEATIGNDKLNPDCSIEERYDFIQAKYVEMRYVMRTFSNNSDLLNGLEQSIKNADLSQLLQVWAEGADLTALLPSSQLGETALHLAVLREMGTTLHIVDFLIQNIPLQGLNKATNSTNISDLPGKNTALHLCALHDRQKCMKLLLQSGADFDLKNDQGKTAFAITKEMGNDACRKLIECAIRKQEGVFDHINTDLNLSNDDDGSTDFSDDATVDKKKRSRSPSYTGEPPVAIRSRSSTCDSIQSGSSPNAVSNQLQCQMSNQLSATYAQSGTSPKKQNLFSQQGRLSPGSMSNITKNYAQAMNSSNRKSLSSSKMEKLTAPTPLNQVTMLSSNNEENLDLGGASTRFGADERVSPFLTQFQGDDIFKSNQTKWQCEDCMAQNVQAQSKCVRCGEANLNASSNSVTNSKAVPLKPGHNFSLLPSSSTCQTATSSKPIFSFGSPSFQFGSSISNSKAVAMAAGTRSTIFGSSSQVSSLSFESMTDESATPSQSAALARLSTTLRPKSEFSFAQIVKKPCDDMVTKVRKPSTITSANTPFDSGTINGSDKICEKCGYTTDHSGHFNLHKREGCQTIAAVKDMNCPICCQLYTYNQLRYHLRQYIKDTSKAKNGHQNFTPEEHTKLLNKLKEEKKSK